MRPTYRKLMQYSTGDDACAQFDGSYTNVQCKYTELDRALRLEFLSARTRGNTHPYSTVEQSGFQKKHECASDLASKGAPPENRRNTLSVLPAIFKWAVKSEW